MSTTGQALAREDVMQQVKMIVIEALHAQKMANLITEDTHLGSLGLDSLNIVDILLGVEAKFEVAFDDEELDLSALETLGSLVTFVMETAER